MLVRAVLLGWLLAACGGEAETPTEDSGAGGSEGTAGTPAAMGGGLESFGTEYGGGEFHLGPVDWDETQWHNACAPGSKYAPAIRKLEGTLLAGLWKGIPDVASYCDACIHVQTERGKAATLRVVTYGDTSRNSIDVSPEAFALLNSDEYPRAMRWNFAKCPDTGAVVYEFQTGSSEWWTSFWVRNARVPLRKVEVKSQKHDYTALARGGDGTLTDAGGFGKGPFSIRLTGADGSQLVHDFPWPSAGIAGQTLTAPNNF